jgi:hypothetical protein
MITLKFIASFLIVAGALGAAYGGFNHTKETHEANIGPLLLQMLEKARVSIPMWTGLGAVGFGLLQWLVSKSK